MLASIEDDSDDGYEKQSKNVTQHTMTKSMTETPRKSGIVLGRTSFRTSFPRIKWE